MKLLANLGGEEPDAPRTLPEKALAAVLLWTRLFPRGATLLDHVQTPWPDELGPEPEDAAFAFLEDADGWAWFNDEGSLQRLRTAGAENPGGADPVAVRATHDKAFALRIAREDALDAADLLDAAFALDQEDLAEPAAAAETIANRVRAWPQGLARGVLLKPRFGTTGRGQRRLPLDLPETLPEVLAALSGRGGIVVEPLLDRIADYSVQLVIESSGDLRLLGCLAQSVSERGSFLGHEGEIDSRGRVRSGSRWEETLRERASAVALRAAAAGYRGPCGVDALSYRDAQGAERLRGVVEWNARFTMGMVAIGLMRRALRGVRERLALSPGELRRVRFDASGFDAKGRIDAKGREVHFRGIALDLSAHARLEIEA
ncbi:MAG: hypothetical protein HKP27_08415 [Myxococcales bacterium]|nr:hypothetical protein [Myxococcales bacterium]